MPLGQHIKNTFVSAARCCQNVSFKIFFKVLYFVKVMGDHSAYGSLDSYMEFPWFQNTPKICTLVSKGWLHDIRNSTRLSGELILRLYKCGGVRDINGALSRWPKLKVLHLSNCSCNYNRCNCISFQLSKLASHWETSNEVTFPVDTEMLEINLTEHALLKKVSWNFW